MADAARFEVLEGRVTNNEIKIGIHDTILNGKDDDIRDQGIIGVMSNIEKHLEDMKDAEEKRDTRNNKLAFAFGVPLALAAILGAAGSVWRVYLEFLIMQQ